MVGHTKFTGYHMDVTQRVLMPVQGLLAQTILVPSIETLLSTREVPWIPAWVRASWTTWGAHGARGDSAGPSQQRFCKKCLQCVYMKI